MVIKIACKNSVVLLLLLQLYLLKKNLKVSSSGKPLSINLLGNGLSHAFLKAMVCLLGKLHLSVILRGVQ